jgi:peptide/nickel transport system permease protein
MTQPSIAIKDFAVAPPRITSWQRFRRAFFSRWIVIIGLVILLVMVFAAIFAPWLAPYDPYKQDLSSPLLQPCKAHLLGTDGLGRDTLSRVIYGSRTALLIGFAVTGVAVIVGMVLGLCAGYFGGVVSMFIMRFIDALMSIPMILLALVIASVLGGGLKNVIIALSIGTICPYTRIMNGLVLSIKQNDYILAERAMGASDSRTMFSHILPNAFQPIIVMITMQLGFLILAEAGLSFLGIGIEPPFAAWGSMVNDGYQYLMTNPALSFAPGICIMLVVFAFNMVGDGLRDALDPRLRGMF